MNREQMLELFAYDTWANDLLFEAVSSLSKEELKQDRKSSHGGIFGTLVHIVGAEEIWLSRWKGNPRSKLLSPEEVPTLADLRARWDGVRKERDALLASFDDDKLEESIHLSTTSGREFIHRYRDMFQHLVNHSSYHRGQVAGMLRQQGIKPPATDLIQFYRDRE